ncbi:HAL/PAL/TAL family ammonia-lyase [Morganella psychrotolerans]|uniref:HAL/PAL/TAL family ammonia-lyase n=1 Tax=Morganella psychrotolerans TaxID=368603 RepID=UPI0039B0DDC0
MKVLFSALLFLSFAASAVTELDGRSLTPEAIARVADGGQVSISPQTKAVVHQSYITLMASVAAGQPVYGMTHGVGLNKDKKAAEDAAQFNRDLLRAHAAGTGKPLSIRAARAVMVTRLNMLLTGGSGAHPDVIETYIRFLNQQVTPLIPSSGSIGEADITLLSHIGLAMIGEGDVYYQGKQMPALIALKKSTIPPLQPVAKDALAIISSNAFSAALAALVLHDISRLINLNFLSYALSLEALNGHISPFRSETLQQRPYPEVIQSGTILRSLLNGSSLTEPDTSRPLQDPLSFRSGVYLLADLLDSYRRAYRQLFIQLNSADDNPVVILPDAATPAGAVRPSANFESLPVVTAFEQLNMSMARYSLAEAQQLVVLNTPAFTGLTRFLGTENTTHAFGGVEKTMMSAAIRNKSLALPVSLDYLPVAGGLEDIATNAPLVIDRLQQQVDNSYELLSILLIHSAQAIDLRRQKNPHFRLAPDTASLYDVVRASVSFMDNDKSLQTDIQTIANILRDNNSHTIIRSHYAICTHPHHQRGCDRRTKTETD